MSKSNANNPHTIILPIGDISADAVTLLPGWSPSKRGTIQSVKLLNNAALAEDNTNNVDVALRKVGGNTMASGGNADQSLVAREGAVLALSGTEADLAFSDSDNIEINITHPGTGAALTDAQLQVQVYYS